MFLLFIFLPVISGADKSCVHEGCPSSAVRLSTEIHFCKRSVIKTENQAKNRT